MRLRPGVVDVIELLAEQTLSSPIRKKQATRLARKYPVILHGVSLGIGDASGPSLESLRATAHLAERLGARWFGEHLAFLHGGDTPLEHFGPLGADANTYAVLRENAKEVRAMLPCPLVLENPADIFGRGATRGGRALGDEFADALVAAGAGALLDLTNLVYNARNEGYEAREFIDAIPRERIVQIHLAGGQRRDGLWIDSHDREVDEEALSLVPYVAARATQLRAITLEWDEALPPLETALATLTKIRESLPRLAQREALVSRPMPETIPPAADREALRREQETFARFLAAPAFEEALRASPEESARVAKVRLEFARWLASLESRRVEAFRRTQRKKRAHQGAPSEGM